jgi:hypothetical protein
MVKRPAGFIARRDILFYRSTVGLSGSGWTDETLSINSPFPANRATVTSGGAAVHWRLCWVAPEDCKAYVELRDTPE